MPQRWSEKRWAKVGQRALKVTLWGVAGAGVLYLVFLGDEWARLRRVPAPRNDPAPLVTAPKKGQGSLVIVGGGGLPKDVVSYFVELAGGKQGKLLVIPTARGTDDPALNAKEIAGWKAAGVADVSILHTRSRLQANDPTFVRPLNEATAVWFDGGRQNLLTQAYLGTLFERELKAVLGRGGVIGGTSAGAAIMTQVMINGGRGDNVDEGTGFDLLPGAIVDQHFMKRNRIGRLLGLLTRHPGLLGFGIDERTALVVRGEHMAVLGESYVMACIPGAFGHPARLQVLKRGDQAVLSSLRADSMMISSASDLDETLAVSTGH